ncbi:MAG: RHS repeat protein, partial [Candidatus Coatesbacteria bacterium]|nr:RHS repeat protein [Candidatus Coatesbacteria bacterium]
MDDDWEDSGPDATYLPPGDVASGFISIEEYILASTFIGNHKDGSKLTFELKGAEYLLTKIEAANSSNYVSLTYNVSNQLTRIQNSNGNYFDMVYDLSGYRAILDGSDGLSWTYSYDLNGKPTSVTRPDDTVEDYGYSPSGLLTSVEDPTDLKWTFDYDVLEHISTITDPASNATTFAYDNTAPTHTTVTLPEGNTMTFYRDADGYTTDIVDGLGATMSVQWFAGDVTKVTDRNGNEVNFAYTSAHNCTLITDELGNETDFTWSSTWGTITSRTDAEENTVEYVYDSVGNLIEVVDGCCGAEYMYYDINSQMTCSVDRNG